MAETISDQNQLDKLIKADFESKQPYKQVTQIYKQDNQGKTISKITSYHPNGELFQLLEVKDGRANGKYTEWYDNGVMKIETKVIGGPGQLTPEAQEEWIFDGESKVWDKRGNCISIMHYSKGFLEGTSTYYFPSGKIQKAIPYSNGKIDGEVLEYNENERLISKSNYKNNLLNEESRAFWNENTVKSIEYYEQGKLITAQYFNKNSELVASIEKGKGQKVLFHDNELFQEIEFKKGEPNGKIKTYKNNQIYNVYSHKNGLKEGEEIIYYLNENPSKTTEEPSKKISIAWKKGKVHGLVKTWYLNGKLESQKEYANNQKSGSSLAWYNNGSLMFIEEYEENLLTKGKYYKINDQDPISTINKGNGTAMLYDETGTFLQKIKYQKGVPVE